MKKEEKHLKSSLTNIKQQKPKRFLTKRILTLFILMMIGVAIFFCLYTIYDEIGQAYRTSIEAPSSQTTETMKQSPIDQHEAVTFLIVGVDYGHAGRLEEKRANVITTLTINPKTKQSVQVNLSRLLKDKTQDVTLSHAYMNGGIKTIKTEVESLLNIPIDHTLMIELSELRPLLDQLGGLDLEIEEAITLGEQRFSAEQTVHLSSREVMLYLQAQTDESEWDHSQRQIQVLEEISQTLFATFSDIRRLPQLSQYFTEAEGLLVTDVTYETLVNFVRNNYINSLVQRSKINLRGDYQAEEIPYELMNDQRLERTKQELYQVIGQ